jgi:hypothetical protein
MSKETSVQSDLSDDDWSKLQGALVHPLPGEARSELKALIEEAQSERASSLAAPASVLRARYLELKGASVALRTLLHDLHIDWSTGPVLRYMAEIDPDVAALWNDLPSQLSLLEEQMDIAHKEEPISKRGPKSQGLDHLVWGVADIVKKHTGRRLKRSGISLSGKLTDVEWLNLLYHVADLPGETGEKSTIKAKVEDSLKRYIVAQRKDGRS